MIERVQPPTRKRYDFFATDQGFVTTAEFKNSSGPTTSYWWTTGLNNANQLTLLAELQIVLPVQEREAQGLAEEVYKAHVLPLAQLASGLASIVLLTSVFNKDFKASLLTEHLEEHKRIESYSDDRDGLVGSLAKQYQLAESLGASTAVEFLALWNEVPVSTIRKRLERARLDGLVPRKRPLGKK
jgi:hypothetical protein